MRKGIVISDRLWLVLIAASAVGDVQAEAYEVTSDWASVSSAEYRDGTADLSAANGWQMTSGVAEVEDHVVYVDDEDVSGSLAYVPDSPSATCPGQAVEVHMPSVAVGGMPDDLSGAHGSMAAVDDGQTTNWYGWSSFGWTKLVGAVPPESGACDVRVVFSNEVGKVCYAVNTGSGWIELKPEGADSAWLTNGKSSAAGLDRVAFMGKTALTDVKLTQTGTVTVSAKMSDRMAAQGIAANELDDTAANGNRNWENLVLGLTGSDSESKPVVMPVQTARADVVTLRPGGLEVDAESGATVKYRAKASGVIGDDGELAMSAWMLPSEAAEMGLPEHGVRYYRMEVVATPE